MRRRNRNDFYSIARPIRLALDNECYASLAVLLTKIQQRSLSCSRRLLLMYENKASGTEIYELLPHQMHVVKKIL